MGLFDKKYCDVCGEKIGLLGNRKLEDGNLCKSCAKKLSPLFNERRHSTVAEIKEQLAYREENAKQLDSFHPDISYGSSKKLHIDTSSRRFIVTYSSNWRNDNPDLISFDQVKNVETDIEESKSEIFFEDENGEKKSYSPRRYEFEYSFYVKLFIDSPWFDEIKLDLTGSDCPDSPNTEAYRNYEFQLKEITDIFMPRNVPTAKPVAQPAETPSADNGWKCVCGIENHGKFCEGCGSPKPMSKARFCENCGWKADDPEKMPKFCPECGSKLG